MKLKIQKGFSILAVILVIVAVVVAVGLWSLSGQSNTSSSSKGNSQIYGSSLLNEANLVKLEFDKMNMGLVDKVTLPTANSKMLKSDAFSPEGIWLLSGYGFSGNGIGASYAADSTIMLAGVKDSVCKSVNASLYGSESIPILTNFLSSFDFVIDHDVSNNINNTYINLDGVPQVKNWTRGCLSASGVADNNLFFFIIKVN